MIPVSTIQRRSEYRWISGTPVILYDQEYVHSLSYLFNLWFLNERPIFFIRGAPHTRCRVQH